MRYPIKALALGIVLVAAPAVAQINVGLGGQAGGNVGVGVGANPGGAVGTVTGTLDRTVNGVDRTVNHALGSDLRVATSADARAGVLVRDSQGRRIGTVQEVQGSSAVVVSGGKVLHLPIASLYRGGTGLVTKLTRAQIEAAAQAQANAGAEARN